MLRWGTGGGLTTEDAEGHGKGIWGGWGCWKGGGGLHFVQRASEPFFDGDLCRNE
jgi:hypothetical protein